MSRAIKISTIEQAEDILNRQSNQLRSLEYQLDNVANEAKQEAQRVAEIRVNFLRQDIDIKIEGLEGDLAEMDRKHRIALNKQANEFYNNLNKLQDWTSNLIEDLEEKVNGSFKKQQSQIDSVRESVNHLYKKEADEEKKAELMLKDLNLLVAAVGNRTNHAKYAPGKWNQLSERVKRISIADVPSSTKISEAVNITNLLWELEEDILKAQLKFEAMHNMVLNEATELLQIMSKNRNELFFTDENGKHLKDEAGNEIKVEIDFWTKGEYGKSEKRASEMKIQLETLKDKPELSEERLKQILAELGEIKATQSKMVILALQRGIASEDRVKISEEIINALMEQGFQINKMQNGNPAHDFLGGELETDQREGVFAILKNPRTGTEISIIIHPDETLTKNQIVFQRNDESSVTQDELRRSIEEVKKIIENKGYKMGSIASPEGTGDNKQFELADANALAKTGIKDNLKEQLGFKKKQTTRR
jgi:hypothetical protein